MGLEDVLILMINHDWIFIYPLLLIKLAFRFGAKIKYGLLVNLIDFWNSVKKKPPWNTEETSLVTTCTRSSDIKFQSEIKRQAFF